MQLFLGDTSSLGEELVFLGHLVEVLSDLITNLFIYQARESNLVPEGLLTAQFLQKTKFLKPLL